LYLFEPVAVLKVYWKKCWCYPHSRDQFIIFHSFKV